KEVIRDRLNWKNSSVWILALFVLHLIGLIYSKNIDFGLSDVSMKLSFLAFPVYFILVKNFNKSRLMDLVSLIGSLSVLVCIGVAYYTLIVDDFNVLSTESDFSLFMHRGYQAIYWSIGVLWSIYSVLSKRKYKWGHLLLTVILIAGVFLTYSKAGILMLAISFAIIFILLITKFKKIRLALISVIGLVLVSLLINAITPKPLARFKVLASTLFEDSQGKEVNQNDSNSQRLLMWETSLELLKENPILGVGTGDVKDELKQRNKDKGLNHLVELNLNSHNQFLNIGVALGGIGVLIMILLVVTPFLFGQLAEYDLWIHRLIILGIILFLLTESAFETQAGVVFLTFVLGLISFKPANEEHKQLS
ncbi:MAG: O-antigen ligase family protein, partial [Crocinitomicaceae bacterium]